MTDDFAARILELLRPAVFTLSESGTVGVWSRAAEEFYGYPEAEAAGRPADFLCFPGEGTALTAEPGDFAALPEARRRGRGGRVERHRRRDGSEVFVDLRLTGLGRGLLVCARDVSAERQAASGLVASRGALGASRAETHRLAGRLLDAQESERRRIALELHDDFKQRLGALGFRLAALAERSRRGGEDQATPLEALVDQVAELGDEVRRISHQLHPAVLERLGLGPALEAHAAELEARQRLDVRVTVRDQGEPLPDGVALGLYRVAQEALENAARHAGARRAHLTLVRDDHKAEVRLAVADDGAGFDPEAARARDGLGLASMKERARLLGGRLRISSEPGAGTEIEVVVPLATADILATVEDGALTAPADGGTGEVDSAPRLIGPYKLLEVLGEGATATVYLAEEPPLLARKVAIKLYRVPLTGRREIYSFKAECQALARLRHPNVGQIHEARTTEDGDPYLVMEYVPGMPITDYCDRYRLDLQQRIELFRAVCEGVQHIHQKGVLHRDLKPGNVLVMERDGRAVPKIVDFGIAKGLDQPLAEGTVWTRGSGGTPAYVSPEVLAGGDADTRSDVYALGVMLYELLTGARPAATEAEILGQLADESLPRPSRRFAALEAAEAEALAAKRRTGPRVLTRALQGDLDWIAAKVLAPEPAARYAAAAALADDLGRHLRAEPILAGPPALGYRLGRFVRRHRAAVVASGLGLLGLVGGLATTSWQARRATQQASSAEFARAESEQVTEFLEGIFEVFDPRETQGDAITAREILDRGAARLQRELAGQPQIRARLQRQLGRAYGLLGLYDPARPLLEESLAQNRELFGEDHPATAASLRELADNLYQTGWPADALPLLERALAAQERTLGEHHLEVADTLTVLAFVLRNQNRRQEAASLLLRAHEIVSTSLPPEHPRAIHALLNLSIAYKWLGDGERFQRHCRRVLELGEQHLGPDHPDVLEALEQLALGDAGRADYAQAAAAFGRLVPRLVEVHGPEHWRTLRARLGRARVDALQNRSARALATVAEVAEEVEEKLGAHHWLTIHSLGVVAELAVYRGQYDRAEAALERALTLALEQDPAIGSGVLSASAIRYRLALAAFLRSDLGRAEALAESILERLPADFPQDERIFLEARDLLARVALARGDLERAESLSRKTLSVLEARPPEAASHWLSVYYRALAHLSLGKALAAAGDADAEDARRSWQLAAELLASFNGPNAQVHHALALLYLGRVDEARPVARAALEAYRYPELVELCERHGIDVPPFDEE